MFMDMHPSPSEPTHSAPSEAEQDRQFHREVMNEAIAAGSELLWAVRKLAQKAVDAAELAAAQDFALDYDRITRSMRRSVALVRTLSEPVKDASTAAQRRQVVARQRVIRDVEDVIQRHAEPEDEAELTEELFERMDRPEFAEDIDDRPVAEIITEICRDMGLEGLPGTQPWKRRTPADIALLCARAAAPVKAGFVPAGAVVRADADALVAESAGANSAGGEAPSSDTGRCRGP